MIFLQCQNFLSKKIKICRWFLIWRNVGNRFFPGNRWKSIVKFIHAARWPMSWTVIVSVSIYLLFLVVLVKSYVSAFWGYIFPADVIFYLLFQILLYKQCKLRYKIVFCTFVCTVFDGKQETVERPMDRGGTPCPSRCLVQRASLWPIMAFPNAWVPRRPRSSPPHASNPELQHPHDRQADSWHGGALVCVQLVRTKHTASSLLGPFMCQSHGLQNRFTCKNHHPRVTVYRR